MKCKSALNNFNAVSSVNPINAKQNFQQDAYVRSADCLMMLKQFKQATQAYQNVIDLHWTMEDYATLQKSIILGGLGKTNEKIKKRIYTYRITCSYCDYCHSYRAAASCSSKSERSRCSG